MVKKAKKIIKKRAPTGGPLLFFDNYNEKGEIIDQKNQVDLSKRISGGYGSYHHPTWKVVEQKIVNPSNLADAYSRLFTILLSRQTAHYLSRTNTAHVQKTGGSRGFKDIYRIINAYFPDLEHKEIDTHLFKLLTPLKTGMHYCSTVKHLVFNICYETRDKQISLITKALGDVANTVPTKTYNAKFITK